MRQLPRQPPSDTETSDEDDLEEEAGSQRQEREDPRMASIGMAAMLQLAEGQVTNTYNTRHFSTGW